MASRSNCASGNRAVLPIYSYIPEDLNPQEDYARLSCRVSTRINSRAEEAASHMGQSIPEYAEAALTEKAQAIFDEQQLITLSKQDFAHVAALIEKPQPPTQKLQEAVAEYRRLQSDNPVANL